MNITLSFQLCNDKDAGKRLSRMAGILQIFRQRTRHQ